MLTAAWHRMVEWVRKNFNRPRFVDHPIAEAPVLVSAEDARIPQELIKETQIAAASRPLRRLRREIEDAANEILDTFQRAEMDIPHLARGTYTSAQADLWGCDFHYIDELTEKTLGTERPYLLNENQKDQAEAVWPVDIASIVPKDDPQRFFMNRLSTIGASEVRGKTTLVVPKMAVLSAGELFPTGRWWAENTICGLTRNRWADIGESCIRRSGLNEIHRTKSNPSELHNTVSVALSGALTVRYSWHVAFGFSEDGPRLLLPTSPSGCVALFRDREKGESGRRNALRHWVSNHYRDNSHSDNDIIYVRDHLRGRTIFEWRGLQCEVLVSQYDLDKNEFFKRQAADWRAQRKHNRVRLRVKDRRPLNVIRKTPAPADTSAAKQSG